MLIDPLTLLVIPMAILLIGLFIVALLYDLLTSRRLKNKNQTAYHCPDCRRIFTDEHRTPLSRCPNCGKQTAPPR